MKYLRLYRAEKVFRLVDCPALPRLLGKGGEVALVQADLDVAVPDALQVNHRRGDVPVAHPR